MIHLKNSLGLRLIIIGGLSLLLFPPSLFIQELISEREQRRDSVISEISEKWGNEQVVAGPILSIPYHYYLADSQTSDPITRYVHFLPETLAVTGYIKPEVRYRSIYEAVLYNSKLTISGRFAEPEVATLGIPAEDLQLDEAFVSIGISDMTGIRRAIDITWNGAQYSAEPGIPSKDVLNSGVSASTLINEGADNTFSFDLNLNGSKGLSFSPVGETTTVAIESDWANPSFKGSFLPTNRDMGADGFYSEWNILHLNRNFPQQWKGKNDEVLTSYFGVELLLPVDGYHKTMRTAKYAIMFIGLTFLTFFMIELLSAKSIHPVQYLLIGFALLIFYTLLLSLSEYISFGWAYLSAAVAIVGLITGYSFLMIADRAKTAIVSCILIALYSYLYVLLQLQDFALLLGSVGLFVVLSSVMFLTRNIDWFDIMDGRSPEVTHESSHPHEAT